MLLELEHWIKPLKPDTILSPRIVNRYIAFIFAASYCFKVQGRIGSISNLVLKDADDLMREDATLMSDDFKTASTFGFQVIHIPSWLRPYLQFYVSSIRPKIVKSLDSVLQQRLQKSDSPLWINMKGTRQNGCTLVSGFFRSRGLNLTRLVITIYHNQQETTTSTKVSMISYSDGIRALVETTAEDALLDGSISPSVRTSISNLSGHSSRTVRAHYLIRQRQRDANNANTFMNGFSKLPKRGIANSSKVVHVDIDRVLARATDISEYVEANEDDIESYINSLQWGVEHKFFKATTEKVPWSAIELQFIGDWTNEARRLDPDIHSVSNKCRQSLAREYPDMIPHFHREHVISASRFAHGLRRYQDICNEIHENDHQVIATSSNYGRKSNDEMIASSSNYGRKSNVESSPDMAYSTNDEELYESDGDLLW